VRCFLIWHGLLIYIYIYVGACAHVFSNLHKVTSTCIPCATSALESEPENALPICTKYC
jgi:hypothetical protein